MALDRAWIVKRKFTQCVIGELTLMAKENGPYKVDKNTRSIANGMIQHRSDKNLLIIMHYLLDILDVIEVASLNFQKRYGLLMNQTKNLAELTTALAKIGANSGKDVSNSEWNQHSHIPLNSVLN